MCIHICWCSLSHFHVYKLTCIFNDPQNTKPWNCDRNMHDSTIAKIWTLIASKRWQYNILYELWWLDSLICDNQTWQTLLLLSFTQFVTLSLHWSVFVILCYSPYINYLANCYMNTMDRMFVNGSNMYHDPTFGTYCYKTKKILWQDVSLMVTFKMRTFMHFSAHIHICKWHTWHANGSPVLFICNKYSTLVLWPLNI